MRIIAFACLTAAVVFAGAYSAGAAPKAAAVSKACDYDACMSSCTKAGGRARLCPEYCQKKFRENPKCR